MRIYDEVVKSMAESIAMYEPERGGALFGPIGRDVVSLFILDSSAYTTFSTYTISQKMCDLVPQIEQRTRLEYKGIVHSHPAHMDRPSYGDQLSARNALNINPHMSRFYMPIITHGTASDNRKAHTIQLDSGKLSCYYVIRSNKDDSGVILIREPVTVISILQSLGKVAKQLEKETDFKRVKLTESAERIFLHDGAMNMAYTLTVNEYMFMFLFNEMFPENAPNVLLSVDGGNTKSVPLSWSMGCIPEVEIKKCILSAIKHQRKTGILSAIKLQRKLTRYRRYHAKHKRRRKNL